MAEADGKNTKGSANRLWMVAVGLGVLFVVLYNLNSYMKSRRDIENQVTLVRMKVDLEPGAVLKREHVEPFKVSRTDVLGLVVWNREFEQKLGAQPVKRAVRQATLLTWDDLGGGGQEARGSRAIAIPMAFRHVALPVATTETPWADLANGDRVDVYGVLAIRDQPTKMEFILEAVKVVGFDHLADPDSRVRQYHSISVELPADSVGTFLEIKRMVTGPFQLSVRSPTDVPPDLKQAGRIVKGIEDAVKNNRIAQPEPVAPGSIVTDGLIVP